MRRANLIMLFMAGSTGPLSAQADSSSPGDQVSSGNSLSVWTGLAWQTPRLWGHTKNRDMFMMAVRYQRPLTQNRNLILTYTLDLIPLIVVATSPYRGGTPRRTYCSPSGDVCTAGGVPVLSGVDHAVGIGIAPIGLQAAWPRRSRIQVVVGTTAGVATFSQPVPMATSRKFNFTVTVGGGVRRLLGSVGVVTVGYKFHHLSNAGTAWNPGLDTSVWYIGWAPP